MRTEQGFSLSLSDENNNVLSTENVPRAALSVHITEYVDIVRQMEQADAVGRHRIEALDMAKKLAHDEAAETLVRELASFGFTHATCRRLWTLLLSLRVDMTQLTGIRGHRPIR